MSQVPLHARLRHARITAGISVEQAAIHITRTAYTVHAYETGKVAPPVHVLTALATLYGTTGGALLDESVSA